MTVYLHSLITHYQINLLTSSITITRLSDDWLGFLQLARLVFAGRGPRVPGGNGEGVAGVGLFAGRGRVATVPPQPRRRRERGRRRRFLVVAEEVTWTGERSEELFHRLELGELRERYHHSHRRNHRNRQLYQTRKEHDVTRGKSREGKEENRTNIFSNTWQTEIVLFFNYLEREGRDRKN